MLPTVTDHLAYAIFLLIEFALRKFHVAIGEYNDFLTILLKRTPLKFGHMRPSGLLKTILQGTWKEKGEELTRKG